MALSKEYFERLSNYSTALGKVKQKHLNELKRLKEAKEDSQETEWDAVLLLRVLMVSHDKCYRLLDRLNKIDGTLLDALFKLTNLNKPIDLIVQTYSFVVNPDQQTQFDAIKDRQNLFRNITGLTAAVFFIGSIAALICMAWFNPLPLFIAFFAGAAVCLCLTYVSLYFGELAGALATHTDLITEIIDTPTRETRGQKVTIDYSQVTKFFALENQSSELFREVAQAYSPPFSA